MIFAFIAAGVGNLIRMKLIKHHYTLFLNIAVSISAACLTYAVCLYMAELLLHVSAVHEAGYICSMLFIIPGFPFITSGIDLAKLDLRSGLERLTYSIIIVLVATMFAWIMALLLKLQPQDFVALHLGSMMHLVLRLIASFCGVFGFSIMFNSSVYIAATAACIGAVAKYIAAGTGRLYRDAICGSSFHRSTDCRSACIHHKEKSWISENFTDSAIHCNYGARIIFVSCDL